MKKLLLLFLAFLSLQTFAQTTTNATIYVGSDDKNVYAIDATTGTKKWAFLTGDVVKSSPAVANGVVYVTSNDYKLYALDASTGAKKWEFNANYYIKSSPTVSNGVVYINTYYGLYALDANTGAKKWNTTANYTSSYSNPTVVNGVVYVGSGAKIYAFEAQTGESKWTFTTREYIYSSPTVVNGVVYIGSDDNYLYAIEAQTGILRWKFETGYDVTTSPTVVNGVVYLNSDDTNLYALDAQTGANKWKVGTNSWGIISSPVVSGDIVYVGAYSYLYAFDTATGAKKWTATTDGSIYSSPVVANGVVYVGSNDKKLYAFNSSTGAKLLEFLTGDYVSSSPCVVLSDGTTVYSSQSGIENENINKNTLRPNPETSTWTANAQTAQIGLNTNQSWTAKSNADWITLNTASGASGAAQTLAFSLTANTSTSTRKSSISFTAGGLTWQAFVEQNSAIYLSGSSRLLDGREQTYDELVLNSTAAWTVSSNADWLSASPASGSTAASSQKISIKTTANTSSSNRVGTLTFTSGGVSQTFTVTQQASGTLVANTIFIGSYDYNVYAIDAQTATKKWAFLTGGAVDSSPTVANGIVYVGSDDDNLYALDANTGIKKWQFGMGSNFTSSPTVVNGLVFVGNDDGYVYALDTNTGAKKWSAYTSYNSINSSPTVSNGIVLVSGGDGYVYAFDAQTGTKKWSVKVGGNYNYSSPIVVNGIVYLGGFDGYIYALDAQTGEKKWSFKTAATYNYSSPTVVNGIVYVGSGDYNLYALDAQTGAKKWAFSTSYSSIISSPVVANGTVYVGTNDYNLYALDANTGTKKWAFKTGSNIYSSPSVANGVVYVGSYDRKLYALNSSTGAKLWEYATEGIIYYSSPCVLMSDGTAIHSSMSGTENENINKNTLRPNPETSTWTANAQTAQIGLNSNQNWTAKSNADWLTINTASGASGAAQTLSFSLTANASNSIRKTTISLTGGGLTWLAFVEQSPAIYLSANSRTIDSKEQNIEDIVLNSIAAWSAKSDADWLSVSPASGTASASNQKLIFKATANTAGKRVGTVTFTSGGINQTFTVSQQQGGVVVASTLFVGSQDKNVYAIDAQTGTKKWIFATGGQVDSSPTVVNGVVYVGSRDTYLYAINANTGTKKWQFSTTSGYSISSSPTVANGVVYVGDNDGYLYALDATTGAKKWSIFVTYSGISSSPTVVSSVVYVGGNDGNLYAFDANTGAKKWNFTTSDYVVSSPTVVNGVVYVGSDDGNLYALDAITGTKKWSFASSSSYYYVNSSPVVVNGVVYVGSEDSNLYALDAQTGAKKWSFKTGGYIKSSPAVVNGIVYVGSNDKNLYAIDANTGAKKWSFATGDYIQSSPTVLNGVVYVGSNDKKVYALDAVAGTKLWEYATDDVVYSSPCVLGSDGKAYHSSISGYDDAQTPTLILEPLVQNIGGNAQNISNSIIASAAWTATSNATWLKVGAASGGATPATTLSYSVEGNTGAEARTGIVTFVSGNLTKTFTVNQGVTPVLTLSSNTQSVGYAAGTASTTINTNYPWTTTSNVTWLKANPVTGNAGNNQNVGLVFEANPSSTATRTGVVTFSAGGLTQTFSITQALGPLLTLSANSQSVAGAVQNVALTLNTNNAWTAVSDATWAKLNVSSGTAGTNQALSISLDANPSLTTARTAKVTFSSGGLTQVFTITQSYTPVLTLGSNTKSVGFAAGTTSTTITANHAWTAVSDATWLKVNTANGDSTRNFNVSLAFEANTSTTATRTGKVTFSAGGLTQIFTVTQDFTPVLTLSANSQNIGGIAGNAAVTLNTNNAWTAISDATWAKLNVSSGTAGTNQALSISVDANPSLTTGRTAKVTFSSGGLTQVFTLTQSYTPVLTLGSNAKSVGFAAGTTSTTITANHAWTAVSDATWLKVNTANGDSTRNFNVSLAFEANTSTTATRTGKIIFSAGGLTQVFTVTQGFTPVLTLSANSQNIGGIAGNAAVTLNSNNAWTALADAAWLKVAASGDAGSNQNISITAEANKTIAPRVGKITFSSGGLTQVFTINQAFAAYLSLSANSATISNEANNQNISVNTNTAWTASSDATWLKANVVSGNAGENQAVVLASEANTGSSTRTGTLTFKAGDVVQIYVITQAALLANAEEIGFELSVYPNPTHDVISLVVSSPKIQDVKLVLMSSSGQNINSKNQALNIGKQTVNFNAEGLTKGFYFVNVILKDGSNVSRKVIIE